LYSHHPLVLLFFFCFVFVLFTLLIILPRPLDNLSYGDRGDTCVVIVLRFKGVKAREILGEKNKLTQSFRNTLGKHLQCFRFVRVALLWRSYACAVLYCEVSCGTTMTVANNVNVSHVPSFGWYKTHGRGVQHENQTTFFSVFNFVGRLFYIRYNSKRKQFV